LAGSITGVPVIPIIVLMSRGFTGIGRRNGRAPVPRKLFFQYLDARPLHRRQKHRRCRHGGDQNDIVGAGRYRQVRGIKRLGIDFAVHGASDSLAEVEGVTVAVSGRTPGGSCPVRCSS